MMAMFEVLQCEYVTESSSVYAQKKLVSIRLTPIGKGLLGLLK